MSELITRRCDIKNKIPSILWLSDSSVTAIGSALFSLINCKNEADIFLIDLMLRRQPLRDLETGLGLRLISPERTRSNEDQGLRFQKISHFGSGLGKPYRHD